MRITNGPALCACGWSGVLRAKDPCPACQRPPVARLDAPRVEALRAALDGRALNRSMAIALVRIGVLRPNGKPAPSDNGRHAVTPRRAYLVTELGEAALRGAQIAEQGRHDVAASVARHADLLDPRPMTPTEVADMVRRCQATTQQPQVRAARSRWHVPRALFAEQVVALRTERASGESLVALAAKYGVSTVTVHRIAIGERYQDAGGPLAQVRARRSA